MLKVYYADITNKNFATDLSLIKSPERAEYVRSIKDVRRAAQSFYSWLLLEKVLNDYVNMDSLSFYREQNGKWLCNDANLKFSISHSNNAVLAAVSFGEFLGADIQLISQKVLKMQKKIIIPDRQFIISGINDPKILTDIITTEWCNRESVFKAGCKFEENRLLFSHKKVNLSGADEYIISVCSEQTTDKFIYTEI